MVGKAILTHITAFILALAASPGYAGPQDTVFQIADIKQAPAKLPLTVSSKISDPDGIEQVRLYFKSPQAAHFDFIPMTMENDIYVGRLPAPAENTAQIDQILLVEDGAGNLSQSRLFSTPVTSVGNRAIPDYRAVPVYTEIQPTPETIDGFTGKYIISSVSESQKLGVQAGLISSAAAGLPEPDTKPEPAPTPSAPAKTENAESTASTTGSMSTGTMLGIAGGAALLAVIAGGGGGGGGGDGGSGAITLKDALDEAINDEYRARATYERVIQAFGPVTPFPVIAAAEDRHVNSLISLYRVYAIAVPGDTWPSRVTTPASILDACQAGVDAETANIAMYDRLLAGTTEYADVQRVFTELQRASRDEHLPAFQQCVTREGG